MTRIVVVPVEELRELIRDVLDDHVATHLEDSRRPPALLDRRGLAEALDVCADTVDRLRREGLPELNVGDSPRFELSAVLDWLRSRPSRGASGRRKKDVSS